MAAPPRVIVVGGGRAYFPSLISPRMQDRADHSLASQCPVSVPPIPSTSMVETSWFWTSRVRLSLSLPRQCQNAILTAIAFFGGNSTKATSGINGALTRTQIDLGISDSVKTFYDDTLKSARDKARPELIKVLTYKSAAAVEWLQDVFNLDLTLVSRLG